MEHKLLARAGRYAVIRRQDDTTPFVVCCSYCDKTKTWGAGFYFKTLRDAMTDYNERVNQYCLDCENCHTENHPTWCMR